MFHKALTKALPFYGAPLDYVRYEEGGLLVNKIRQKPYSIVLFDEIEQAYTSVYDVFLQIMDQGKLHDRLGKERDFSKAFILSTICRNTFNYHYIFLVQVPKEAQIYG